MLPVARASTWAPSRIVTRLAASGGAFLPEFVQTPAAAGYGFGASITRSGLMLLPSSVTMFVVGLFAGRLTRKLGGRPW